MKYKNAKDIFPKNLLRQIQKYVSGELIYIPSDTQKKKEWGETSGYRRYLYERNRDIKAKFSEGATIEALAEEYHLSFDSVKKIVYSKKEVFMLEYKATLSSAMQFAKVGKIEEWVHTYLLSDGHNKAFSDGLKLFDRYWIGPITMPLSEFPRCVGPEEGMRYSIPENYFQKHVKKLMDVIQNNKDMPPLIVHFYDHKWELNDGNHRNEAYKRLGITEYPVIVWITEKEEYEEFLIRYSEFLNKE